MDTDGRPTPEDIPTPATDKLPEVLRTYRSELTSRDEDIIDPGWAGSIPAQYGVAPRIRIGHTKWFNLLWFIPIGFVILVAAIAVARGVHGVPAVQDFMHKYPGTSGLPSWAPSGFPGWVGWQHFFNLFLMIFIIRSGWQVLADHPRLYWTRHSGPGKNWFRMQHPIPPDPLYTAKEDSITLPAGVGLPEMRHTIGLARWWHLGVDTLWLANGIVFYVLIFSTGQSVRLVPLHWDVIPNSISVAPVRLVAIRQKWMVGRQRHRLLFQCPRGSSASTESPLQPPGTVGPAGVG